MAPVSKRSLSALEKVIDGIPEQVDTFRNQSMSQRKHRSKERSLFRKFLAKLAGPDKEDQVAFMVNQAQVISSKTYVKAVLKSIPEIPDYLTLQKKNRPTYAHVHSLIDKILPIAAGSEEINSQKRVFESRWEFLHKQRYEPTTMTIKSVKKVIETKFEGKNERIEFYLNQARNIDIYAY